MTWDAEDVEEVHQHADAAAGMVRLLDLAIAQQRRCLEDLVRVRAEAMTRATRLARLAAERAEEARAENVAKLSGELRDLLATEAANT